MHGRLLWAYKNDPIVRNCLNAGVGLEEIIDHLAHERAKLLDVIVKIKQSQPQPTLYVREPDGRVTVATNHGWPRDMGGVGGSQGG